MAHMQRSLIQREVVFAGQVPQITLLPAKRWFRSVGEGFKVKGTSA